MAFAAGLVVVAVVGFIVGVSSQNYAMAALFAAGAVASCIGGVRAYHLWKRFK